MKQIRVLIVDDSAFMRRVLTDILKKDHRIHVVGTARNGKDCLKKLDVLRPDVVTMDIEMPVMDGLEALKKIMESSPLPVVMVSSLTQEGAESTMKAMSLGAVDFIQKPSGSISLDMEKVDKDVVRKVLIAGEAKVNPPSESSSEKVRVPDDMKEEGHVIAIGTSTGGPRALQEVLTSLPGSVPAPILVVQHMPKGFTKSLASRLNRLSEISVKEAEHREEIHNGVAYIAPGGYHMEVVKHNQRLVIHLNESRPLNGHRPSVNVMFSSIAKLPGISTTAVIMTGMGADGLEGILAMKEQGRAVCTIAEDESTCVVYGMPKAIVKSGLADDVQKLNEISRSIVKSLQNKRR
ncbi:chemotaxis response regulator protein-glutamate methylesterase [Halobacillus trueperi]|uniref:Protein-glutamate methylesterase/protein-glutamine glutaminase n=1 Tax=Halobacillus trueperi TaxID=156205 RepID=A0A3D8VS95_9BACI|nr:chemotaxis response regulator protein-glutamate methylesterase [Halobacillus trueperi]RDY72137.1 chemotaxis response regulator protein-glutamate methylesterase [Halobacillus trueperi]